jgi:hypothetical protein
MPPRIKSARSATSVNLSGPLRSALELHAIRRLIWLFRFLFALQATCDYIKKRNPGFSVTPLNIIRAAATHQVDVGIRSDDPQHTVFDKDDTSVVNIAATDFTSMDAAHFCNLGLDPTRWGQVTNAAQALPGTDAYIWDLIDLVEVSAGDTVQLPQRINIGPDRVIDKVHWEIANSFYGAGGKLVTVARIKDYVAVATAALQAYGTEHLKQGHQGLDACCKCYLSGYSAEKLEEAFSTLRGNIHGECTASNGVIEYKDYAD